MLLVHRLLLAVPIPSKKACALNYDFDIGITSSGDAISNFEIKSVSSAWPWSPYLVYKQIDFLEECNNNYTFCALQCAESCTGFCMHAFVQWPEVTCYHAFEYKDVYNLIDQSNA